MDVNSTVKEFPNTIPSLVKKNVNRTYQLFQADIYRVSYQTLIPSYLRLLKS